MLKNIIKAVCLIAIVSSAYAIDYAPNERAATLPSQAITPEIGSAGHSIAASGQATSAVSSMPLPIAGTAWDTTGAVSAGATRDSMNAATIPIGMPLDITGEAITIMPPIEVMKTRN